MSLFVKKSKEESPIKQTSPSFIWIILLIGILMLGSYFRFIGLDWDEDHHLHPDERFLTMVASAISPVDSVSDYFNTETSTLNPHNQGYGFYVYGTLPLFVVRYIAEWVGKTGYGEVYLVGRAVSAVADLLTIILIYLVAVRIYKNHRLGLFAAAFSAMAVLQIQLSHYFTVDIFANLFSFLTFYLAVVVLTGNKSEEKKFSVDPQEADEGILFGLYWRAWLKDGWTAAVPYILFGGSLGMAMACKVSTFPLALLLPVAAGIRLMKHSPEDRSYYFGIYARNIALAALVSVIAFRIFQPYAFSGPGIFGLIPNDKWVQNLKDLSRQSGGDVDFPPALQWARRPLSFGFMNLVKWGLGLPLGILSSIGFIWMGFKVFRGEAEKHGLLWVWTFVYFVWQSLNFTSSMRYYLMIYPTLAIIAAWTLFKFINLPAKGNWFGRNWKKILGSLIALLVLGATIAWAFAFSRIYSRPVTRVEASNWIYQNVPTAINLSIDTDEGLYNQPLAFRLGSVITADDPYQIKFTTQYEGLLSEIGIGHIVDRLSTSEEISLTGAILKEPGSEDIETSGVIVGEFTSANDPRGNTYSIYFDKPLYVYPGEEHCLKLEVSQGDGVSIAGAMALTYSKLSETRYQYLPEPVKPVMLGEPYEVYFTAQRSGTATEIYFPHIVDWLGNDFNKDLSIRLFDASMQETALEEFTLSSKFSGETDPHGDEFSLLMQNEVELVKGQSYVIKFGLSDGFGELAFYGSKQALESTWDDPLPIGLDGYNPFDYYHGLYRTDLNFEMYWDDNEDKRERFYANLDQADYLFISSNRQWGTTIRVPERYPLTTEYYRNLIGCPAEEELLNCYADATPGMFSGNLGFKLVKISQSDPNLGDIISFNTQYAEEAFTVYDAPKVLIFKKTDDYDPEQVRKILGAVDLTKVIHLTPKQASEYSGNLLLPSTQFSKQQLSGTWSDLFDREKLLNSSPVVGLVVWYLVSLLLGWVVYPLTRLVFSGLSDRGYPLARIFGLLLFAYLVWAAGSAGISVTRSMISIVFVVLLVVNLVLFLLQRESITEEIKTNWKYFLSIELLALLLFTLFLLVRIGNPDLWHPYKGGEKPMDFSYLNAILKSETFPPYDPWFAGGYINYYYFGLMIVSIPVKWLGIVPATAYNFILPTLFCVLGLGAFSVGWNLLAPREKLNVNNLRDFLARYKTSIIGGSLSTLFLLILGNLGTVRMIWHGFQKIAADIPIEDGGFLQRWAWTFQGFAKFISGEILPFRPGDWYWIPSRTIPKEPITEFPGFTFLYADLHAHMIALPLTVMAIAWAVSIVRSKWNWNDLKTRVSWLQPAIVLLFGGLIIGSLMPTNTWDLYTYLPLGCAAVLYAGFTHNVLAIPREDRKEKVKQAGLVLLGAATLVFFAKLFYLPFTEWYGQGYNSIQYWENDRTPFWSYFTHWGLFLFIIFTWLLWETRQWMANTPVSALNRLRPYIRWIQAAFILLVIIIVGLLTMKITIAWLVLPMVVWAGVLIFQPGQSDLRRMMLFMTGTALLLTLVVELVALKGDIGRMNTVFKLYLQAWTMLSILSGAMLISLLKAVQEEWDVAWRTGWTVVLALLIGSAALFPLLAGVDKINDRMNVGDGPGLDGMAYMQSATYWESDVIMDLNQDYEAIIWMQENVEGTPVIVEANTPEYRWGSRYTIYTGLPGVVGWNWHQRQQRAVTSSTWVTDRVEDINHFYRTIEKDEVEKFLEKYDVSYVIVGQLERAYYAGAGLDKFDYMSGEFWEEVYRKNDTVIYKVIK